MKIYPDKIEVTDIAANHTITKSSTIPFSSSRLLIAEFNIAVTLTLEIIRELRLAGTSLKVLIQQMTAFEGGLCESEKRILRDLAEQVGGKSVYIVNRTQMMNDEEILGFLKLKPADFKP